MNNDDDDGNRYAADNVIDGHIPYDMLITKNITCEMIGSLVIRVLHPHQPILTYGSCAIIVVIMTS